MNALDLVLVVFAVGYAVTGYQQGFLVGACSTLGLLGGGFAGVQLAPRLLDRFDDSVSVSFAALLIVLCGAFLGQALGVALGLRLRRFVRWRPARLFDALSGAALSVAAMLVVAWILGVAASGTPLPALNEEVRRSAVLGAVDEALPGDPDRLLSAFDAVVGSSGFPRYLEPFAVERIVPVRPPRPSYTRDRDVRRAGRSVVKVLGAAPACGKTFEGSGFVYTPGRVMTNAHVVAGVRHPVVRLDDTDHRATVVYYDPQVDIAVLAVPGLAAAPLHFGPPASFGRSAAVLGYPEDGPFDAQPARVRSVQTLSSPDIYGDGTVSRQTYAVNAVVREGNSGGPLVSMSGRVLGVVFAASVVDDSTGYALTAAQVSAAARAGSRSAASVSTGGCAL